MSAYAWFSEDDKAALGRMIKAAEEGEIAYPCQPDDIRLLKDILVKIKRTEEFDPNV